MDNTDKQLSEINNEQIPKTRGRKKKNTKKY